MSNTKLLKKLKTYTEKFSDPVIAEFVQTVYKNADKKIFDEKRQEDAFAAADIGIDYLQARRMYNPIAPNKQMDTTIAGILLHNVCYDRSIKNWMDIFKLRNLYMKTAEEIANKIDPADIGALQYIFQIVECQMNEDMPVSEIRPANGQITYIVWEILWLYYYYKNKDNAKTK